MDSSSLGARCCLGHVAASATVRLSVCVSLRTTTQRRHSLQRYRHSSIWPYANMKSSIKPEVFVHNVLHRRQRRTEPRPATRGGMQKFEDQVQFRRLKFADRRTDRRAHHNTPPPLPGRSRPVGCKFIIVCLCTLFLFADCPVVPESRCFNGQDRATGRLCV